MSSTPFGFCVILWRSTFASMENRGDMGNSRPPFWTVARLEQLRRVLDKAAERDESGAYFGAFSLGGFVTEQAPSEGLSVSVVLANSGLTVLVFLGIIGPGKQGVKRAGVDYRRRYYPERPVITEDDLARYRQHVRDRKAYRER